jgi:hypothetical protein
LATTISGLLNSILPASYYARILKRPELGLVLETGTRRWIIPDVVVARHPVPSPRQLREASVGVLDVPRTAVTDGIEVRVHVDPLQHHWVEIRDVKRGHKLITLIEIVSPSNKRPGPDRRAYEAKQREVLESDANLMELDLLRDGARLLPYPDLAAAVDKLACDYLILLNRSALRQDTWMDYTLYPVDLREPLPCIPVPLVGEDPDVPLDLQVVAQKVYREGPYLRAIDYSQSAEPPLSEEDAAWADEVLRAAGLRGD